MENFMKGVISTVLTLALCSTAASAYDLAKKPFLPTQVYSISTIPTNGDLNPYGVAFVHASFVGGTVKSGDVLVSNFNNNANLQGTGSTIVDITPSGKQSVFFQGNGALGLTTALNVLKKGLVLVGSFPSSDGACGNAQQGSILVLDHNGQLIQTITDPTLINGPWDSFLIDKDDKAKLFIANALSGTVVRFDLAVTANGVTVESKTQIASGYKHQCDPVTFVDGPTGLAYDRENDLLYIASTLDNAVFAIPTAANTKQDMGRGQVVFDNKKHLHGPLGLVLAPNGNLIVSNNDAVNPDPKQPSELVEFTPKGQFVRQISVDGQPGGAFGLAISTANNMTRFAAVDDNQNVLLIWDMAQH